MKTKLAFITSLYILLAAGPVAAQSTPGAAPQDARPLMAVIDVSSTTYNEGLRTHLTNVLRTELFKTNLFRLVERGLIQRAAAEQRAPANGANNDSLLLELGKALKVEKLFIASVERISQIWSVNVRIVDVDTALVFFTDNVNVDREELLTDALKETVLKIDLYLRGRAGQPAAPTDPLNESQRRAQIWTQLGAEGQTLELLLAGRTDPEEYLFLRQYDIRFQPQNYIELIAAGTDLKIVRTFLQAGVSYPTVQRALRLGVTSLDRYREVWQPRRYSFEDFLEAYEQNIGTPAAFNQYRQGFERHFVSAGVGFLADRFPVANSQFTFGLAELALERFWNDYQRDFYRWSTSAGLFMMARVVEGQFFAAPVPYLGLYTAYFGAEPYYIKAGTGVFFEALLGGHVGTMVHLGVEVLRQFEFRVFLVPFGTQPNVSYQDLRSQPGDSGYQPLVFPYFGILFGYKFPVAF